MYHSADFLREKSLFEFLIFYFKIERKKERSNIGTIFTMKHMTIAVL